MLGEGVAVEMANKEHLRILKQGVSAWNAWRRQNPKVKPDLTEANLRRSNLTYSNLTHATLTHATLANANLTRADLTRADLTHADLTHANLTRADLMQANITQANLMGVNLTGAKIAGVINVTRKQLSKDWGDETLPIEGQESDHLEALAENGAPPALPEENSEKENARSTESPTPQTLVADANERIALSGEFVPQQAQELSLEKLQALRETIEGIHPFDRAPSHAGANSTEIALDGQAYDVMVATVDYAIALHQSPTLSDKMREILANVRDLLQDFATILAGLGVTIGALTAVIATLNEAIAALTKLLAG